MKKLVLILFLILLPLVAQAQTFWGVSSAITGAAGTVTGGSCTNQLMISLDSSGVPTCADVSPAMIADTGEFIFPSVRIGEDISGWSGYSNIIIGSDRTALVDGFWNEFTIDGILTPAVDEAGTAIGLYVDYRIEGTKGIDHMTGGSLNFTDDTSGNNVAIYGFNISATGQGGGTNQVQRGLGLLSRVLAGTSNVNAALHAQSGAFTGSTATDDWTVHLGVPITGGSMGRHAAIRIDNQSSSAVDDYGILIADQGTPSSNNRSMLIEGDVTIEFDPPFVADGGITALNYASATMCLDGAGNAACGTAPAGSVVVDAGDTDTVVSTTAIKANSQIFLQVDQSLGTALGVTCNTQDTGTFDAKPTLRTAGTSFTIALDTQPTTNPLCISYFIIN